ncbi:DNA helicase B [Phodopus roborovskii]|uniref:DNA helicase B n=1 Tax=Phodopus roborovskii TaxID=109678 RepID=A0AAU9YVD0_PHORO|nr:DNA helicase B [Phodopus roborovskii]CAH6778632.1 Helb [Phodopus roborovskii]
MAGECLLLLELLGPLQPDKDTKEEESVPEDEGDQDSEFVDAEELCSGGIRAGSLPGRIRVSIPDENTKERYTVQGRFPLVGPWWRVKVRVVKPVRSKVYQAQGFPSYFLQTDVSPRHRKNIFSLFLKECNYALRDKFMKWVENVLGYENLNFGNLRETLRNFERRNGEKSKEQTTQSEQATQRLPVEDSFAFVSVMIALRFPKVMQFLPVLLPRHFRRLISSDSEEVLQKMEDALGTHPWKLGFRRITYREMKLLACEASWTAFGQCPSLLQLMTEEQKNALVIYSQLKHICREDGHTYVEIKDLTSAVSKYMSFQEVCGSLEFMKDLGVVIYEKDCIFLSELYQAEQGIASAICDLMSRPPWHLQVDVRSVLASICNGKPKDSGSAEVVEGSQVDEVGLEQCGSVSDPQDRGDHIRDNGDHDMAAEINDVPLDQDQVAALEMICANAVTVLSGKGGCGKTTIVSHLFKHVEELEEREVRQACEDFEQDRDASEEWLAFPKQSAAAVDKAVEVLLTAPTGKAAALLRQKTDLLAYTLYQVSYSFYFWKKLNVDKPWKFSTVRVLVVDEGSLVSVGIFKSVLKILCEHTKLSKLIILGDIRQLPSIEPGNVLQDVFETLKSRGCAIELKTNHRTESQLIVDNATRISRRQFPEFDAELSNTDNPMLPISIQDKTFIFVRLPEEDGSTQSSKGEHQSNLYSAVTTLLQGKDFESAKTSQFIAFRRQDCDLINDCCSKHYTGHLIKDHEKKLIFGVGDKICCTRNAYLSDLLPDEDREANGKGFELVLSDAASSDAAASAAAASSDDFKRKQDFESGIRLCNGEIFFITKDVTDVTFKAKRLVTINNDAGLEVTVDFSKLMRSCHIKHAWARTIHTFQGSEENTVAYVVGKAGRQHWQHVYTAVTRGRSRVYVIAQESELRSAIRKRSFPRKTRLKYFLQKQLLSSDCASPTGSLSQPSSPRAGERPSTQPPASPFCRTPDKRATTNSARGETPSAAKEGSAFDGRWLSTSFNDPDTEESAQPRGSKRTGDDFPFDEESPSKFQLVEKPSPQVSSIFQNLRLNNLAPRQLFKPTDNQETIKSGVVGHTDNPSKQEADTGGS